MKRTVALLFGGRGEEHAISCRSAAAIWQNLREDVTVRPLAIDRHGESFLYFGEPKGLAKGCFDRASAVAATLGQKNGRGGIRTEHDFFEVDAAIPALHGNFGEDGVIQGYLTAIGIPFVGTPTLGGAIASDKALTKMLARSMGVPTLPSCTVSADTCFADALLTAESVIGSYPYFVKPNGCGSSIGASVAADAPSFRRALKLAASYGEILIEPYLHPVRELEIGVFFEGDALWLSDVGEIAYDTAFYDYDTKYHTGGARIFPHADIPDGVREQIRRHTHTLVRLLGVRDLCRFDYFLSKEGALYFNELNTFPGFTKDSLYPILIQNLGFDYKTLLLTLIENAYARGV